MKREQACNCLLGEALAGEKERKAEGGALHLPAAQLGLHSAPGRRERPGRRRCKRGGRGGWRGGGAGGNNDDFLSLQCTGSIQVYASGLALEQIQRQVGRNSGHSKGPVWLLSYRVVFLTSNPEFG